MQTPTSIPEDNDNAVSVMPSGGEKALKPKRTRTTKPKLTTPIIETTDPSFQAHVGIVFHEARDGSRTGVLIVGPNPYQWLVDQQKAKPNAQAFQKDAPPTRVAPSELDCWKAELTRHRKWADGTYVAAYQSCKSAQAVLGAKHLAIAAAHSGRVYLVDTVEA